MDSIIALVLQVKFCFMSCLVKIGKQWLPNIKRGGELPKEEHFFAHSILMKAASKSIWKQVLFVFIQLDWGVLVILVVHWKKITLPIKKYLVRVFEEYQWGACF